MIVWIYMSVFMWLKSHVVKFPKTFEVKHSDMVHLVKSSVQPNLISVYIGITIVTYNVLPEGWKMMFTGCTQTILNFKKKWDKNMEVLENTRKERPHCAI